MTEQPSPDFPEYDGQTAKVWDRLAEWWDDKIGDGNSFQDYLIEPASERLLTLQPGEQVLDIACGAGRWLTRSSASGPSFASNVSQPSEANRCRRILRTVALSSATSTLVMLVVSSSDGPGALARLNSLQCLSLASSAVSGGIASWLVSAPAGIVVPLCFLPVLETLATR